MSLRRNKLRVLSGQKRYPVPVQGSAGNKAGMAGKHHAGQGPAKTAGRADGAGSSIGSVPSRWDLVAHGEPALRFGTQADGMRAVAG